MPLGARNIEDAPAAFNLFGHGQLTARLAVENMFDEITKEIKFSDDQKEAFCAAVLLMCNSTLHEKYTVNEIKNLIIPPILLGQSLVFKRQNEPNAFVSWAYLSDTVAKGFANDSYRLKPQDWKSGNELWVMDFIAPFGNVREISSILRDRFAGQVAKSIRFDGNRKLMGRPIWKGRKRASIL